MKYHELEYAVIYEPLIKNIVIINDVGFTIESGETDYQQQSLGEIILITQDGAILETQGGFYWFCLLKMVIYAITSDQEILLISQQDDIGTAAWLIAQQEANTGFSNLSLPHVDLSISTDGGASFGNQWAYYLPPIGHRKNRLMWWQCGIANDFVPQFKFWGMGRFVVTDGVAKIQGHNYNSNNIITYCYYYRRL